MDHSCVSVSKSDSSEVKSPMSDTVGFNVKDHSEVVGHDQAMDMYGAFNPDMSNGESCEPGIPMLAETEVGMAGENTVVEKEPYLNPTESDDAALVVGSSTHHENDDHENQNAEVGQSADRIQEQLHADKTEASEEVAQIDQVAREEGDVPWPADARDAHDFNNGEYDEDEDSFWDYIVETPLGREQLDEDDERDLQAFEERMQRDYEQVAWVRFRPIDEELMALVEKAEQGASGNLCKHTLAGAAATALRAIVAATRSEDGRA